MYLTAENKTVDFQSGQTILVNKPLDWTSFDVVNKIRSTLKPITGKIKVGHAGTLDPKAEGLLIVCTGKHTKIIHEYQNLDKEYEGEMFLGASTPSYDIETEIDHSFQMDNISIEDIRSAANDMTGEIMQTPPVYSAIKIKGEASYLQARKGLKPELKERRILINEFLIHSLNFPVTEFYVNCSKGTYIRSLVHDLGKNLGGGAYLLSLKRSGIGNYKLKDAWQISDLVDYIRNYAMRKV